MNLRNLNNFVCPASKQPLALEEAAEAAAEEAKIEGDLHGSAAYKKQLVRVYLQRTLHEARRAIH